MFLIINRLFKKCKYIKEIIHIFDQQMHLLFTIKLDKCFLEKVTKKSRVYIFIYLALEGENLQCLN